MPQALGEGEARLLPQALGEGEARLLPQALGKGEAQPLWGTGFPLPYRAWFPVPFPPRGQPALCVQTALPDFNTLSGVQTALPATGNGQLGVSLRQHAGAACLRHVMGSCHTCRSSCHAGPSGAAWRAAPGHDATLLLRRIRLLQYVRSAGTLCGPDRLGFY